MAGFIAFAVLALLTFPVWTIARIVALKREMKDLAARADELERELQRIRNAIASSPGPAPHEAASSVGAATESAVKPEAVASDGPLGGPTRIPPPEPPLIIAVPPVAAASISGPEEQRPMPGPDLPPFVSAQPIPRVYPPPEPEPSSWSRIEWEQFMGAKLFAWLGGLAAFLGAAFFVKYSFEHNLIPPELRVSIGFLFGLGLIGGGLKIPRPRYAVTAQTLIATGIVTLYAVTFACNSIYHFAFFGPAATFAILALITASAFLLAVRLEAKVVAVLGILAGFLTPVLLSTGHDNAVALFGYVALLDLGLIAVALHRRWYFLVPLGAAGTVLMQVGWGIRFFNESKAGTAIAICLLFSALFLIACALARRRGDRAPAADGSALGLAAVSFGFALVFVGNPALHERPTLVFTFVALATVGCFALSAIAQRATVMALAAAAVACIEFAWTFTGTPAVTAPTAMAVALLFCALFLGGYFAAWWLARNRPEFAPLTGKTGTSRPAREVTWAAAAMPFVALVMSFGFLALPDVASRPGLLLLFTLGADAFLLVLAWFDEEMPRLHLAAGATVFAVFAWWTAIALTNALLPWAFAFYLAYAILHTAYPLLLQRRRAAAAPGRWSQIFPPLALLLVLIPLFKLDAISLMLWPCVLLVDVVAIGAAIVTGSLAAVATVLLLTLAATGVWIWQMPGEVPAPSLLLLIVGGFAVFFFAAATYLGRRQTRSMAPGEVPNGVFGDGRAQLPAFAALLPFILLVMTTQRLTILDPSPIFALALLLVALTLGLAAMMALEWLPGCALIGVAAVEYTWAARQHEAASAPSALCWYLVFYAVFAVYPFIFRRRFLPITGPWAVSAIGGALQFPLVYHWVQQTWPNHFLGIVPALFAIAPITSFAVLARSTSASQEARLNHLAWYGGVGLLFVTLIFPIQFERQWLTVGWALEGAALLWLFHRVPHVGLRATGVILLVISFARLAINPAVLGYHPRSVTPLLNWYLYSYGIVTAALFVGARLAAPPRDRVLNFRAPSVLNSLGTILAFLLVNIEIADFFSAPGAAALTFQFSGNFARDMSYTIAWSLFALALLLLSIWRGSRSGRYAALGLLAVAVLKLFFHDLARLDSLYRIAALFAVALVAIVASFAYQRFLPANTRRDRPPP